MDSSYLKIVNVALRGATLVSKFFFIFFLAYYLEPHAVALYGLLTVTVSYSLYALGFDFYTYSTRELLGNVQEQWARLIRDQGVFFALTYVLVLPLLALVFFFELLPWFLAPWFFMLVVVEHLSQELNRLLVAISRQLLASVILFLRSGLWAIIAVISFWLFPQTRSLEYALSAWVLGALISCIIGIVALSALERKSLKQSIDWKWIRRGIAVAVPFLIATLSIRGVFTIDRYWVKLIAGQEILASYVLFAGIANAVTSFLDAGVFVFLYPKIVSAFTRKDQKDFVSGMRSLLLQTVLIAILLSLAAAILVHPLLWWLGKDVYSQNVGILYVVLFAIVLYAISMVPHYGLYAMSKDRHIIFSHLVALPLFALSALVFTGFTSVYGIPLALCFVFLAILIYKGIVYQRCKSRLEWASS